MGYTLAQAKAFIEAIAPLIQKEATNRGYHSCASVVAQAIIESAAGTSGLARYHNYFGMKCGSSWKGKSVNLKTKEEYKVGVLTTIKDNFRVYDSMAEGVKGYYDFISSSRYSNLKSATDYETYARYLKNDGYATSSTYISTLISTVKKYELTQYDRSYMPTLRKGSTGSAVKELQTLLNYHNVHGGTLTVDGIFGMNTYNAVIDFQGQANLIKDGIVGVKTWNKLMEN